MKNISYVAMFAGFLAAIFFACEKETAPQPESNLTTVNSGDQYVSGLKTQIDKLEVINGRLKFETWEQFTATIEEIRNQDDAYLNQWEAKQVGFTSMLKTEKLITNVYHCDSPPPFEYLMDLYKRDDLDDIGSCVVERPISDKYFAQLLNPEGVIQIGNDVYQFDRENWRRIKDATEEEVQEIRGHHVSIPDHVTVGEVDISSNTCYNYLSSTKRMKGNIHIINYVGAFSVATSKVVYEEKTWCCWKNKSADYLRIQSPFFQVILFPSNIVFSIPAYDSGVVNNVGELNHTFVSTTNLGFMSVYNSTGCSTFTCKKGASVVSCVDCL